MFGNSAAEAEPREKTSVTSTHQAASCDERFMLPISAGTDVPRKGRRRKGSSKQNFDPHASSLIEILLAWLSSADGAAFRFIANPTSILFVC